MEYKTPTAMGGRGLETLASTLRPHDTATPVCRQGNCGMCAAFDPYRQPNVPGFGYCKRRSPSVAGNEFWPRVRPGDWCLEFVPEDGKGRS